MVPPSDSKIPADPQLFQATISSQDENWAKGVLRFLWRQPFVLLGGLWLLMVVIAVVALGGLASPGDPEQPVVTRDRSRPAPAVIPPRPRSTSSAPPTGTAFAPGEDAAQSVDADGEGSPDFPLWSLAVLVGCCAAGSIMASRQINAPTVSRQRRAKKRVKSARSRPTPPPPPKAKRLKPYMAHPGSPMPSGEVAPGDTTAIAAPAPRHTAISVVPDDEIHALDWPEGSLAHQLDLRQQKSLSSLL
jgi:hypothetical protein